jgi:8-oxo-dGTP diphosphatase
VYEFAGAQGGTVSLSFDPQDFLDPNTVLIIPFYRGQVVFVKHSKRGWELPGGTREKGEFPIQTAIRELFEEAGAEAEALELVGQYVLEQPARKSKMVKSIYVAKVTAMYTLPEGFETVETRLLDTFPDWQELQNDSSFSFILKDGVYRHIVDYIKEHRFARA